MKLIIDIPEEEYEECKIIADLVKQEGMLFDSLGMAVRIHIADGTPLPKGHGKLMILSKDKLKENQIDLDFSGQKWISEVGLSNATVAIIEADEAESEDKNG